MKKKLFLKFNNLCFIKGILGLTHIPRDFPEMVYETCKKIPETKWVNDANNFEQLCLCFPEFSVLLYFKVSKISGFISWDFIFQDMGFSHGIGMPSPALRAQGEELTITFINWY